MIPFSWPSCGRQSFIQAALSIVCKSTSNSSWNTRSTVKISRLSRPVWCLKTSWLNIIHCVTSKEDEFFIWCVAVSFFLAYCNIECELSEDLWQKSIWLTSSRAEKWKPSRCSTYDIFRAIQLSLQAAMAEPLTQVCWGSFLIDRLF